MSFFIVSLVSVQAGYSRNGQLATVTLRMALLPHRTTALGMPLHQTVCSVAYTGVVLSARVPIVASTCSGATSTRNANVGMDVE